MKKPLLLIFLILISFAGVAQNKPVGDSLLQLINASKSDDTTKVLLLLEYARYFVQVNLDSAEEVSLRAVHMAERISFPYGFIRGYNTIAMVKWRKNDIPGAKRIFLKALALADKEKHVGMQVLVGDNLGIFYHSFGELDSAEYFYKKAIESAGDNKTVRHYTKTLADLAGNYTSKANYVEAIHCLAEAKRLNADAGDKVNEVVNCISLGNIYLGMKDFRKAIEALREAARLNDTVGNLDFRIAILQNTGLLYNEVKPIPDSARYYLNKAREMAQANNRPDSYFSSLINLGNVELLGKNYRKALEFYLAAYESPVFARKNYERAAVMVNLGNVYHKLGEFQKAEKFAKEGTELAHKGGYLAFEQSGLIVLSDIAAGKNNFKQAYEYLHRASGVRDSIWSEEIRGKVEEATFNLALRQAETENSLLLKDNEIKKQVIYTQWFIVGGIVVVLLLVIVLMVIVFRNNKRQKVLNSTLDAKNKELEELNITKDKFISIIAHDLKSPFNALLGFLTELDENYLDYDEKTKHDIIHKLKKSSFNTFNLLINLLDWSQSQQGKLKSVPEDFMFGNVTEEVFAALSTRASMKNQTLSIEFNKDLRVYSDPQIIKSILINLVNNAIKFTPSGGWIRVTAKETGKGIQFSVEDSGIGIPAAETGNLFRLDSSFNRKGTEQEPGTGLGLVMCQEYVIMLRGTIDVISEEGKGSRFVVTLPNERPQSA
jgi:signal transduction histidine kinase/Flp pilus assembly protein TadD